MPELNAMLEKYPKEALELARLVAAETTERILKKLEKKTAQQREWITKDEAINMMQCSYTTLNNRVNEGLIRKSNYGQHGQKYYNRPDIEAFLSGQPNKYQP